MQTLLGLSLWAPWGTLIAIGAKRYETRGWKTELRGVIAIQQTKSIPPDWLPTVEASLAEIVFQNALIEARDGRVTPGAPAVRLDDLPMGAIVALARLDACARVGPMIREMIREECGGREMAFGNFADGRYAWSLADVVRLPEPVYCRGGRQLWPVPDEARAEISRQLEPLTATLPAVHRAALSLSPGTLPAAIARA